MKIAVVIENYRPHGGGNERSTEQIVERLAARGHAVTVLTCRAADVALPGGVTIEAHGGAKTSSAWGLWRFARWAEKQLASGRFDVSLSVTLAVAADVVQPRGGTVRETLSRNIAMRRPWPNRVIKEASIGANPKQLSLLWREWRTLNSGRVRKVVAISGYVADQLFRHYCICSRRIVMIPNAAVITPMSQAERQKTRRQVRNSLQLADGDVAMLFAATNPRLKGLDRLLEAAAQLRGARDTVRLVIAGTDASHYQRRAEQLGVRDMVRWVGPTRQIDALYAASDVLVHPTYYDPSSKVVIEALLHGIPAISTAYNGASQWIDDVTGVTPWHSPLIMRSPAQSAPAEHRAGRVVRGPEDIPALAMAMRQMCDPEERQRCAAATRQLDRALTMDRHVAQLEALLTEVAGSR